MNNLAPAGLALSVAALLLTVFAALCIFGLILNATVGAIAGIIALVAASIGLTMTSIARSEIVENAQFGDGYAISGMAVGIVACALSAIALILYFVLFK